MAVNWDLYNKRLNVNGDTKRDRNLSCLQNKITSNLPDSLSCKSVQINSVNRQLNFTETKTGYDIQSLPNETFSVGDYVIYKTLTYLITKVNGDDEVYTKGSMEQCNYTLKFQSPNGTILSYPCITDNRVQGTGDTDTKVMTLPVGRKIILLPHDENTTLLRNDRRLFVDLHPTDPRPYEIDFVDSTKFNYGDKGLLEIYVSEDQLNSLTDRVDLGVCDYFEPSDTPEPPDPEVPTEIVTITSDDAINNEIVLGLPHLFSATFKNELGEDVDNVIAEYSVDNTYDGKVVLTDNGDGTCTVQVGEDAYELLTSEVVLKCEDVSNNYSSSVTLTIVALL